MDKNAIKAGLAAYKHEQTVMLRILRRYGEFTADDFDRWLQGREWRRPRLSSRGIDGDTIILGMGINGGTMWAKWLELLQYMMFLGMVKNERDSDGRIKYMLGDHG